MKILKLDSLGGASGDMLLGALIGLGADGAEIQNFIDRMLPGHARIVTAPKFSFGIQGLSARVELLEHHEHHEHHHHHDHEHDHHAYAEIRHLIEHAALPERARELALKTFRMVAEAEGKIHGKNPDDVTFHEVGAVDSIVDIVGCCIAFVLLDIDAVSLAPLPTGFGTVRCQHGLYPVPAPATAELIRMGQLEITDCDEPSELLTPTGAALLGAWPRIGNATGRVTMQANAFGQRELQHRPNLLRAMLLESVAETENDSVLEGCCNLDDVSPETLGFVMEQLFAAGALDVWQQPIVMKKQRAGVKLGFLCAPKSRQTLAKIIFRETGTFGIRFARKERLTLERETVETVTQWGTVRVKIGHLPDGGTVRKAEFDDCRKLALAHDVPLREIADEACRLSKRN